MKKIILTGDRPTGPLHIGHLLGTLEMRKKYQEIYDCYFLIADYQVLYDNLSNTKKIPENVKNIILDWLSVGLDPKKSTFVLQSQIPQLSELTMYFSFLVTIARLKRNPTIKEEAKNIGIDSEKDNIVFGFLGYPVSQAADILLFKADYVPVGEDQLPHIEQTREIARNFNRYFGDIFPEPQALLSPTPRILGLDGKKMGKSANNAIFLTDSPEVVREKVKKAVTDSGKEIKFSPKDKPMISNLITIYSAFSGKKIKEIETQFKNKGYQEFKNELTDVINEKLEPIRKKRKILNKDISFINKILKQGTEKAQEIGEKTMKEVRKAVFNYDW